MPVPMLPPAPDLLSTTNGTPSLACMCCCRMRASRSADPPAANGTTMVTWRCGHSCAQAGAAISATTAMQAATMARICNLQVRSWITGVVARSESRRHAMRWILAQGSARPCAVIRQIERHATRGGLHRLQMGIALLVKLLVGVAHGLRLAASEHDLDIDRLEAGVLVAVNDAGGATDALPWTQPGVEALAALVLDEDIEIALEHEEALLHLVGMRSVALAWLDIDD